MLCHVEKILRQRKSEMDEERYHVSYLHKAISVCVENGECFAHFDTGCMHHFEEPLLEVSHQLRSLCPRSSSSGTPAAPMFTSRIFRIHRFCQQLGQISMPDRTLSHGKLPAELG
mmetsp:Transcript_77656/g.186298  ORF Transcript_77656/g.186298 Transcript_77656/m.186298 type:complete len:115 (+) Transcript_77656:703-1047(+)